MVVAIGNVDVAGPVRRHVIGKVQLRLAGRAAVPAEAALPRPGDRGDRSRGIDPANAVVVGIGDVDVAREVHRHAPGAVQPRLDRRPPVSTYPEAGEGIDSIAGNLSIADLWL